MDGVQLIACSMYWSSDILPDANDVFDALIVWFNEICFFLFFYYWQL